MQPYFVPYIGYFQLMAAVDRFVLLDDVNFIKRGWINRNRLPDTSEGKTQWLTLPLLNASQNRLIRDIQIAEDNGWKKKLIRTMQYCYSRACYGPELIAMFEGWMNTTEGRLTDFLAKTLSDIACRCGVHTEIIPSSSAYSNHDLRGQDRILDICRQEDAAVYVNLPGGQCLYDRAVFRDAGVDLAFIDPTAIQFDLSFDTSFGPYLSVLDLLARNSADQICRAVHTPGSHVHDNSERAANERRTVA